MLSVCNLSLMKSLVHVLKSFDLIWVFFYVCVWNAYEDFWSFKSKCEVSGNLEEYMKFPLQTTQRRRLLCCWKTVTTHRWIKVFVCVNYNRSQVNLKISSLLYNLLLLDECFILWSGTDIHTQSGDVKYVFY